MRTEKWWMKDDEANCWRFALVSRIQSNALRRFLLIVTLPFMLLWWLIGLFITALGFAFMAALYLALATIYPIWHMFRSFPIETFRSFAHRWNVPMEHNHPNQDPRNG